MPPSAPQWSMHLSRQNKEQCPFQLSKAYVDRRAAGDVAPPIKVDGGVIVEGNHRYIAGRFVWRRSRHDGRSDAGLSAIQTSGQLARHKT
jgi:hypothetical protein